MTRADGRKSVLWGFTVIALTVAAGAIGFNVWRSGDPHWSLGEWENVHDWRKDGRCVACHTARGAQPLAAGNPQGRTITPAKYHSEDFRRYTHGRSSKQTPEQCARCHERAVCEACHARPPETHVSAFTHPDGPSEGLEQHVLLGRLRPSSCLVCHRSLVAACMGCHTAEETIEWQEKGREALGAWTAFAGKK